MTKEVADQATKYNLALEKHSNEGLLLNVLRASQRRPLYFTALAKFSGFPQSNTGSLEIPFGHAAAGSPFKFTPDLTVNPLFDVVPLDTQEFMRGILQPVPMDTVEYYWRQGWQKMLLLTLFIARIESKEGVTTYRNYPPNEEEYCRFNEFLSNVLSLKSKCSPLLERDTKMALGPSIDASKISVADVKALVDVANTPNFIVEAVGPAKLQLYKMEKSFSFKRNTECRGEPVPKQNVCVNGAQTPKQEDIVELKVAPQSAADRSAENAVLRSPEGIIYFLGEIVREELKHNDISKAPKVSIDCRHYTPQKNGELSSEQPKDEDAVLFYVREATEQDTDPYISVNYEGIRYVVPRLPNDIDPCKGQRTMEVLTLISQLVQMQKSAQELPTTATVRLFGQ